MGINIVTNYHIVNVMKSSRYFRVNLGLVPTVEKNGRRELNEKDSFARYYNTMYKTTIYGQGNIGDIKFYTDHYIRDMVLAVYYGENMEEFIFDMDDSFVREKGVDAYIGKILKECDERYEELKRLDALKKLEEKPKGDATKIINNPGSVSYEDLKAYLDEKRKQGQL
jgi:hypothetical protein